MWLLSVYYQKQLENFSRFHGFELNDFHFRIFELQEVNDNNNGYDTVRMPYSMYAPPESQYQFVPMQMAQSVRNAENEAINGESSDVVASYAEPAGTVLYPFLTEQSRIAPYANGNIGGGYNPGAFAVQSGYEGFLVPEPPKAIAEKAVAKSNNELPFIGSITSAFTSLTSGLPSPLRSFATQAFAILSALLGATVVGGGLTTAICTFTPLCTISFALPFTRSGLKSLATPFFGAESVDMLDESYATYKKMQDKFAAKSTATDGTVTKSVDGKDVTPDVAQTIQKVNSVMEAASKEVAPAASADPAPKTIVNDKSNDK